MFSHLVESDLHTGEFRRRSTFFLATLSAYALILMAASVVGVAAYEARIEDQNLELVALVPPEINAPKREEQRPRVTAEPRSNTPNVTGQRATGGVIKNRPNNVSEDLTKIAGAAQAATTQTPPIVSEGNDRPFDPSASNPFGTRIGGDSASTSTNEAGGERGLKEGPPPIVKKQPEKNEKKIAYIGVVNGRALSLPEPTYPAVAKAARIEGVVTVEILIDEAGRVASAHATGGHPFLRPEAERAALRARFSPTLLSQQPVKAKGIITFNFILQK